MRQKRTGRTHPLFARSQRRSMRKSTQKIAKDIAEYIECCCAKPLAKATKLAVKKVKVAKKKKTARKAAKKKKRKR